MNTHGIVIPIYNLRESIGVLAHHVQELDLDGYSFLLDRLLRCPQRGGCVKIPIIFEHPQRSAAKIPGTEISKALGTVGRLPAEPLPSQPAPEE